MEEKDRGFTRGWWSSGYYDYSSKASDTMSSWGYTGGYSTYGKSFYERYSSIGFSDGSRRKLSASIDGAKFSNITELMSKAYRETREMILILDFPYDVKVAFSNYDGVLVKLGGSDKFIFLDTKILDETTYSDSSKVNIICGFGVHEACHLKYTSKLVVDEFFAKLKYLDKSLTQEASELRTGNIKTVRTLFNLIEDIRVENNLLLERPGYSELLSNAKDFGLVRLNRKIDKTMFPSKDFKKFSDALIKFIRYPDEVEEEIIFKNEEVFNEIRKVLYPIPSTTKESAKAALKIFNIVSKKFKDFSSVNSVVDNALSDLSECVNNTCATKVTSGADGISDCGAELVSNTKSKISRYVEERTVSGVVIGDVETGKLDKTFFYKTKGNRDTYLSCVSRISKYVPAIRKLINANDKNYDFNIYGCRSGLLDTTKLAEAYQGVPQVYVRKGEVRTNKLVVGILIDESGSMGCGVRGTYNGRPYCSRSYVARDAAILLNEAIKSLAGVDLYIYGHTADTAYAGSTELYIYREGHRPFSKYALSDISAKNENRDGTAIFEVANRIRKFNNDKGILFVISDGSPAASGYWGPSATKDVREQVKKAEMMGFSVIQISIGLVPDVKSMFDNYLDLTNEMSELPTQLSKVVKKAIISNKVTTIK